MIRYAADQADVLVNARGPEGVTPLLLACQYAQMGSISTLLDLVHHTPHPTPHPQVLPQNPKTDHLLCIQGANPALAMANGMRPLHVACSLGLEPVARALLRHAPGLHAHSTTGGRKP